MCVTISSVMFLVHLVTQRDWFLFLNISFMLSLAKWCEEWISYVWYFFCYKICLRSTLLPGLSSRSAKYRRLQEVVWTLCGQRIVIYFHLGVICYMSFKELFSRTKYTHYRRDIHVLRRTKQVNHHYYKSHTLSHLHVKTHKSFCTG